MDFEGLAPETNDQDTSSVGGCVFLSFTRASGACEAAHHCCCYSSFLELSEGLHSLRNGLFGAQGKLRETCIDYKSYADTFQNIVQEKFPLFF